MIIQNGSFTLYAHVNKVNGKIYVGITKRNPISRWKNGNGYKENPLFHNAIQKYGWENFDHEIIASGLTEEEACHMERFLISSLNLQNDQFGYNLKDGGTECSLTEEAKIKIGNALRGRVQSDEIRAKLSEAHKGKKLSAEHSKAIAKANKGRPRTQKEMDTAKMNGIKMSGDNHWTHRLGGLKEESKQKISTSLRDYFSTHSQHEPTNKKKILQIETGIIFDSIEDAAKSASVCRSQISEAAVGVKRKTAKGYHWKFI